MDLRCIVWLAAGDVVGDLVGAFAAAEQGSGRKKSKENESDNLHGYK